MGWKTSVLLGALWMAGAIAPAWAEDRILPFTPNWPDLPGNGGIEAFYGVWQPNRHNDLKAVGEMYFRNGRITFEKSRAIERIRVLYRAKNYFLALRRFSIPVGDGWKRRYEFLVIAQQDRSPTWRQSEWEGAPYRMLFTVCGVIPPWRREPNAFEKRWVLTDRHWAMRDDELLALWDGYEPCNPRLGKNKASAENPWGENWDSDSFILINRTFDKK